MIREAIAETPEGTALIVSLAARPGTSGTILHNAGYRHFNLPFRYVACQSDDFQADFDAAMEANVRGISVSMPHKRLASTLVDAISPQADAVGAVNTILNCGGYTVGFNTDCTAARTIFGGEEDGHVLVYGRGGAGMAFWNALSNWQRQQSRMVGRHGLPTKPDFGIRTIVNATPLGMNGELALDLDLFPNCDLLVDAVIGDTPLVAEARRRGIKVRTGREMARIQARYQFEIYTGFVLPEDVVEIAFGSTE